MSFSGSNFNFNMCLDVQMPDHNRISREPASNDQNLSIEGLPRDMHFSIFGYLEPLDIISIGKTCKTLHFVSSCRTVWVQAFREMCRANGIFMPTFASIEDKSIKELRWASTSPFRMIDLFRRDRILEPLGKYNMSSEPNEHRVRSLFLVPGGRFLVTLSEGRKAGVRVWDLGCPYSPPSLQPVQWWSLAVLPDSIFAVSPDGNTSKFRIAVSSSSCKRVRIYIFEYDPHATTMAAAPTAELDLPDVTAEWEPGSCCLSQKTFVCVYQSCRLLVWNFVDNFLLGWSTTDSFYYEVFVRDDKVFLVDEELIQAWTLPATATEGVGPIVSRSREADYYLVLGALPPVFDEYYDPELIETMCSRLEDWYFFSNGEGLASHIHFISRIEDEFDREYTLRCYTLAPSLPANTTGSIPILSSSLLSYYGSSDDGITLKHHRICNGHLLLSWYYEGTFRIRAFSPYISSWVGQETLSMTKEARLNVCHDEHIINRPEEFSFDPTSGRFCGIDGEYISILDFLPRLT